MKDFGKNSLIKSLKMTWSWPMGNPFSQWHVRVTGHLNIGSLDVGFFCAIWLTRGLSGFWLSNGLRANYFFCNLIFYLSFKVFKVKYFSKKYIVIIFYSLLGQQASLVPFFFVKSLVRLYTGQYSLGLNRMDRPIYASL